jgi:hypothetical protein
MEDRRSSRRIPFREKVKYGSSDNPNLVGYTFNLSEGGVGIKAYRVFPPRSKIVVFLYTGDEVIRILGLVVWVSPTLPGALSSMGVKFLSRADSIRAIYRQKTNEMSSSFSSTNIQ